MKLTLTQKAIALVLPPLASAAPALDDFGRSLSMSVPMEFESDPAETAVPTPSPTLLLSTPNPSNENTDVVGASSLSPTMFQQGTCGDGLIGNGVCNNGLCCSMYGYCGEGPEYCNGVNELTETEVSIEEQSEIDEFMSMAMSMASFEDEIDPGFEVEIDPGFEVDVVEPIRPLPDNLKPEYGFRCGFSEVDARSNCKRTCTHHTQCSDGEECWGVQLNYCNTFEEGTHPICTNLDMASNQNRCGYDETSARGHCGSTCSSDLECGSGEFCFPTLLNLCECHDVELPEESKIVFAQAKALLTPYFVAQDPSTATEDELRSSSSVAATMPALAGLGLVIAIFVGL